MNEKKILRYFVVSDTKLIENRLYLVSLNFFHILPALVSLVQAKIEDCF